MNDENSGLQSRGARNRLERRPTIHPEQAQIHLDAAAADRKQHHHGDLKRRYDEEPIYREGRRASPKPRPRRSGDEFTFPRNIRQKPSPALLVSGNRRGGLTQTSDRAAERGDLGDFFRHADAIGPIRWRLADGHQRPVGLRFLPKSLILRAAPRRPAAPCLPSIPGRRRRRSRHRSTDRRRRPR